MTRARWFLVGLLVAVAGGAVAVTQGGFPANPNFQSVNIKAVNGNAAATFDQAGSFATYIGFKNQGTNRGYVGVEPAAGSLCLGDAGGDFCIRTTGGAVRVSTDNGVSSTKLPRMVYFFLQGATSSCAANSNTNMPTLSCVRNSMGNYTVSGLGWSSTVSYVCTATVMGGALGNIAAIAIPAAGSVTLSVSPVVETQFAVTCMGT